jgi:four helix bundle protein
MQIARKEARETHYWLRLLKATATAVHNLDSLLIDCSELIRILSAILISSESCNESEAEYGSSDTERLQFS